MEIKAFKPGNVSIYSAGHGMCYGDFATSADCIAPILAQAGLSVGERILSSVQATRQAVDCNTNLGIVLLFAPLCHSYLRGAGELQKNLKLTLKRLTVNDFQQVFKAIQVAKVTEHT